MSSFASNRAIYDAVDSEALISKSTWSLKLSGLVFAGLLVLGRSASYGNVTWTPTLHPASLPLTVIHSQRAPAPSTPNYRTSDPADLSKPAAAEEVIAFSPGNSAGGSDAEKASHGSGHGSGAGTAGGPSSTSAKGSGHGSGAGSAGGPSITSAKGSGGSGAGTAGGPSSTSAKGSGHGSGAGSAASAPSGQTVQQTSGSAASAASNQASAPSVQQTSGSVLSAGSAQ